MNDTFKDSIQDCNLNFLVGSGLSVPFLTTLANVEILLTDLAADTSLSPEERDLLRGSIFHKYFDTVIVKNLDIVDQADAIREAVQLEYQRFILLLNTILLKRKSTIINKQTNLFTTNIDVFLEKALEKTQVEFNDGFYGRFEPVFSLTNFRKSVFKTSLHYDNTSEIPVFNLMKIHGSLTWLGKNETIVFSDFSAIRNARPLWEKLKTKVIQFNSSDDYNGLKAKLSSVTYNKDFAEFLSAVDCLNVVNPTKEKFQNTTLNLYYYELLRMFSNELEKENSLLIIMGFSLSDEHIREIIVRAANSNPTLAVKILAYDINAKGVIDDNIKKCSASLRYSNIEVLAPESGKVFDLKSINNDVFQELVNSLS